MSEPKLRWGILGAADIARKNWKAIFNSGNGVVSAVASRNPGRSHAFVEECQRDVPFVAAPQAFDRYEALLASKDVDAVYIPLPTGVRKEWVIRAAEAGKHVVSEKPCANSVADLREMIETCRRHQLQFMDGVMFSHSRRLDAIREALDDGRSIGGIKRIAAAFSFGAEPEFFTDNIRAHSELEPHGCVGDLGWYCIRFALWTMNGQLPHRVAGRLLAEHRHPRSTASVPTEFSGELFFEGGVSCGFYCSFLTELQQWVHLSGAKGSLLVQDFVLPDSGDEIGFEVSNPVHRKAGCDFSLDPGTRRIAVAEHSHSHPTSQETNLFRNFADQIRSGQLNKAWPDIALKTQRVMESCLASARTGGAPVEVA